MKHLRNSLLLSFALVSTFLFGQNYNGSEKEINDILNNIEFFSVYIMQSDYDMIAESYTDDAKIFPSNTKIIKGKDNIKKFWTLPEGVSTKYHKIFPSEISIKDTIAYDYGTYEGTTKRKDDSEVSWKGKYVIIWKKIDGEWKIYLDIWNNISD